MRRRFDSIRSLNVVCRLSGALVVATLLSSLPVQSQQVSEPSWRSGVSRWNGTGYVAPSDTQGIGPLSQAATNEPTVSGGLSISDRPATSAAPYTMPVDPTRLPPMPAAPNPTSVATANPFFELPAPVDSNPLGLGPTNAGETADSRLQVPEGVEIVAPEITNSSVGDPPSTNFVLPPEPIPSLSNGANSLAAQEPIDRLDTGGTVLPPPAEIPLDQPPLAETTIEEVVAPGTEVEVVADPESGEGIVEKLGVDPVVEPGPLESEVIRWYQYPQRWMRGWDSHAEFGLDGATGNARTLAIQTGLELKRQTDNHTLALDIDFRQASNRSVTTEKNGRLNLDYDRLLHGTPWSGFGKFGMEWDKFKAFDLRLNMNGGVGYYWVRQDDANLVTRFGAGASREIGAPDDSWTPEAVLGGEAERQLTPRQKIKGKVDYFPAWENFNNYRLVSDLAWEILLDGSDNLSLKLAATDRYDSTPQGAKKNDLYYSLLLLYKF